LFSANGKVDKPDQNIAHSTSAAPGLGRPQDDNSNDSSRLSEIQKPSTNSKSSCDGV